MSGMILIYTLLMRQVVLVAHNLRSAHNVGSLLRTADGLGVKQVYLTGYTPYPKGENDTRLPHLADKINKQISKTALGAEKSEIWQHNDINETISSLRQQGYTIAALEQSKDSIELPSFHPPDNLAIMVGREVEGLEPELLASSDLILEIPMSGQKESFNVTQAAAMALYHCRYVG
jgi:23S rRNA (guanosine2251-2'-O)-methyltransferase